MNEAWAWLEVVLGNTTDALLGIDLESRIIVCSAGAASLLGRAAEQLNGATLVSQRAMMSRSSPFGCLTMRMHTTIWKRCS
ncbi:MAG: hypothetical protein HC828_10320 [Blastochloris sp.]|nr:hypothetical protein [Blastochloris sp.]